MLRTISPNRVGSARSARAEPEEKFPEGVPGPFSWAPAGYRPDAGLLGGPLFQGRARTQLWPPDNHDIKMQAHRNLPGRGFSQTHHPKAAGRVEPQEKHDFCSRH